MFAHNSALRFACGALRRGFKSRQHEVFFGEILVPQNSTISCANIIFTGRVYKLNKYIKPGCPFKITNIH